MSACAKPCLMLLVAVCATGCTVPGHAATSRAGALRDADALRDGGDPDSPRGVCGNGIVEPGEWCDDGNRTLADGCENDCGRGPCATDAQCPSAAPSCSMRDPSGLVFCRPANASGAPVGERCESDAACASDWCHPTQHRCTVRCESDLDCAGVPNAWCVPHADPPLGYDGPWQTSVCAFGCMRESDCSSGTTCTLALPESLTYFASWCTPETSAARPGEMCGTTLGTGETGVHQRREASAADIPARRASAGTDAGPAIHEQE